MFEFSKWSNFSKFDPEHKFCLFRLTFLIGKKSFPINKLCFVQQCTYKLRSENNLHNWKANVFFLLKEGESAAALVKNWSPLDCISDF